MSIRTLSWVAVLACVGCGAATALPSPEDSGTEISSDAADVPRCDRPIGTCTDPSQSHAEFIQMLRRCDPEPSFTDCQAIEAKFDAAGCSTSLYIPMWLSSDVQACIRDAVDGQTWPCATSQTLNWTVGVCMD